jgi:hypothetical protein
MRISKDQAKDLAKWFRAVSVSLGDFRFDNWSELSEKERSLLEDREWTLINYSSDFITQAVGQILVESTESLEAIKGATAEAIEAINKIKSVKKVLGISSSVLGLGAAIATNNFAAIADAVGNVIRSTQN